MPYLADWNLSIQREITPIAPGRSRICRLEVHAFVLESAAQPEQPGRPELWRGPAEVRPESVLRKDHNRRTEYAYRTASASCCGPYPQYQDVLIFRDPYGDMHYESMTAAVVKQYSHGLLFQLAYTLSKTIANTAQSNTWVVGPSNAMYNANYNRGLEANDVPHRLVLSYIYDLPFGTREEVPEPGLRSDRIWRLGIQRHLGIPERPPDSHHRSRPDESATISLSTNGRANRLHSPVLDMPKLEQSLVRHDRVRGRAPFTIPTDSLSQPDLRSQRRINTDFSLFKNTRFKEKYNVQFRAEFYNIFNHPALRRR